MAETQGLDAKRAEIESRLAALRMTPSGDVTSAIEQAYEEVAAFKNEVAHYEAELAGIDSEMQVRERARRAAAARSREEREADLRREVVERHQSRLGHVEKAEAHLRGFVSEMNAAAADHKLLQEAAKALHRSVTESDGTKLPAGLDVNQWVRRVSDGLAALLRTLRVPGALNCTAQRIGAIELTGSSFLSADASWVAGEERAVGPAIDELISKGRR